MKENNKSKMVVYFMSDKESGSTDSCHIKLGYDAKYEDLGEFYYVKKNQTKHGFN